MTNCCEHSEHNTTLRPQAKDIVVLRAESFCPHLGHPAGVCEEACYHSHYTLFIKGKSLCKDRV
jgi:hypothetical protein